MATVFGNAQWRITDYQGVTVSKIIYFSCSDAATVAQIVTDLTTFAALLDGVTDGAGSVASFDIGFSPALKGTPVQGNPLGEGGLTTFNQTGVPLAFSDLVPAFKSTLISNGHIIETPGSAYANYRDSFITPLTTITLVSNQFRTLPSFRRNKLVTRKHRRGQSVATTEE